MNIKNNCQPIEAPNREPRFVEKSSQDTTSHPSSKGGRRFKKHRDETFAYVRAYN